MTASLSASSFINPIASSFVFPSGISNSLSAGIVGAIPSGKYSFNVKLDDESFSVISIGITVNGELDNEVILDAVNINPYK